MEFAHNWIREMNAMQRELVELVDAQTKREMAPTDPPADIIAAVDAAIRSKINAAIRVTSSKEERSALRSEIKKLATEAAAAVVATN